MTITIEQAVICSQLCRVVSVERRQGGQIMLDSPFCYPDGDRYPVYVTETTTGGFRLSDGGHTLMHLSYENDIDKFLAGSRGILLDQIISQDEVAFDRESGAFYVETSPDLIATALFRLGQAVTRVYDLTFLNRAHVASTFYDDLKEQLTLLAPEARLTQDYLVPGLPDTENYPVDFCLETEGAPLFVYGVPNRDKARLATIFLQHLIQNGVEFDSLLVFANQEEIPRADLARLSNIGGEMIASLNAESDFRRKLARRLH